MDGGAGTGARGSGSPLPGLLLVTQMEDIDQQNDRRSNNNNNNNNNANDNDYDGGDDGDDDAMAAAVAAGPVAGRRRTLEATLSSVARGVQGAESLCDDLDRYNTYTLHTHACLHMQS